MPNWIPSSYPGGRTRLIPRRTSFNASRRSAESAARYSVTVDAGMGRDYRNGFDGATVISEARVSAKPTNSRRHSSGGHSCNLGHQIPEAGVLHVRQGGPPEVGGPLTISPARRERPEQLRARFRVRERRVCKSV